MLMQEGRKGFQASRMGRKLLNQAGIGCGGETEERGSAAPPKAVCGGGGSDKSQITVANGNHAMPGRSDRVGVTSDEAENAPRLRV